MELTSNINIVPGLSGINLNILHALDMHMIDNAKHTIFKWIQKEHRIDKLRYIISKSANAFKCFGDSLTICSSSILASLVSLGANYGKIYKHWR
jgi:hypothetical protein